MTTAGNFNVITLFKDATSNGSSTTYTLPFTEGEIKCAGVFGGATVTFYVLDIYGNAVPQCFAALTNANQPVPIAITNVCNFGINFIAQNESIYATISGAGGSTDITVTLQRTH